jgi:hypothetical protein
MIFSPKHYFPIHMLQEPQWRFWKTSLPLNLIPTQPLQHQQWEETQHHQEFLGCFVVCSFLDHFFHSPNTINHQSLHKTMCSQTFFKTKPTNIKSKEIENKNQRGKKNLARIIWLIPSFHFRSTWKWLLAKNSSTDFWIHSGQWCCWFWNRFKVDFHFSFLFYFLRHRNLEIHYLRVMIEIWEEYIFLQLIIDVVFFPTYSSKLNDNEELHKQHLDQLIKMSEQVLATITKPESILDMPRDIKLVLKVWLISGFLIRVLIQE